MNDYCFIEDNVLARLLASIKLDLKGKKAVIGISGGKDSSITAGLLTSALGAENVIGINMPNGKLSESDVPYVETLEKELGIKVHTIDISESVNSILKSIENMPIREDVSEATITNLPARIRMSTLFAVAQTVNGRVINTCNLSEDMMGYSTLFGDFAGSYAPLKYFTVNEVHKIGKTLGMSDYIVYRIPSDGLSGKTDEDNMGIRYCDIDKFIRNGYLTYRNSQETITKIVSRYLANKFKLDMVNIPGPSLIKPDEFPNYLIKYTK